MYVCQIKDRLITTYLLPYSLITEKLNSQFKIPVYLYGSASPSNAALKV